MALNTKHIQDNSDQITSVSNTLSAKVDEVSSDVTENKDAIILNTEIIDKLKTNGNQ